MAPCGCTLKIDCTDKGCYRGRVELQLWSFLTSPLASTVLIAKSDSVFLSLTAMHRYIVLAGLNRFWYVGICCLSCERNQSRLVTGYSLGVGERRRYFDIKAGV